MSQFTTAIPSGVRAELTNRSYLRLGIPLSVVVIAAAAWGWSVEREQSSQGAQLRSVQSESATWFKQIDTRLERIESRLMESGGGGRR